MTDTEAPEKIQAESRWQDLPLVLTLRPRRVILEFGEFKDAPAAAYVLP
jgi:hypothetical protein